MAVLDTVEPFPDVDIWSLLFEHQKAFPKDKTIYIDAATSRSKTFAEVKDEAAKFGTTLILEWQWEKDDVLAICTTNSIDVPALIWGTQYAAGVVAPLNPASTVEELTRQLIKTGARAMCTQPEFLGKAKSAALAAGMNPTQIFMIGCSDTLELDAGVRTFSEMCTAQRLILPRPPIEHPGERLAFLVFSSGTTGLPKAVKLTHRNVVSSLLMLSSAETELSFNGGPNNQGDCLLGFLPFFHVLGLMALVHLTLYKGLRLVVMQKFTLSGFCQAVQDYKITYAHVVPPVVLQLSKSSIVDEYDLSSIRMLACGAAPLSKELIASLWQRLSIKVVQGYGLSETCGGTHMQTWYEWQTKAGTIGRLLAHQTAKLISESGQKVPIGMTGELCIKGPNIFAGYLDDPQATAQCFTASGYFRTGDIGYQDESGNFYITDRLKELIKYNGFQVPPAELESILLGHSRVVDACVVAVDDHEHATQLPLACVVLRVGEGANKETANEIKEWVDSKVPHYKKLRGGVLFVKEVPRSATGKILRSLMKQEVRRQATQIKSRL
ncbi:hypothetical protein QM012_006368 [Aureobasidium pullulans]|uniref:Acetyl-CoA synthetase-like protein n=1 Tax=Aureobasidium pullulans TaxID=5580 RepID=A0ABR0TND3_AURPU